MSRGSEWGRWDLHIHTKNTAKNDQFGNISFDKYCIELFKKALQHNIKAIGITDYFSIENYKKVKVFQDQINLRTDFNKDEKEFISRILLLPNMELRISPSTGSGTLINLHFILNPLKIDDFENLILNQIQMIHGNGKKFPLTRYGLTELGKLSLSIEQQQNDNLAYRKGIEQFCIPHSQLIEVFESHKNMKNELLIFVTNGDSDGVSGLRSHEEILADQQASVASLRSSIYQLADGLFSPKPSDYKYFLGKGREKPEQIISKYRSLKPCIHGSDAHRLEELFEPKENRYCWIKAEPTFEGLKQIIHEPESRVHIGQHCPETKNQYEVIDYIELSNSEVENERIYFNSNLTSIIGGRSSGKSTLLQCLANKLHPSIFSPKGIDKPKHLDSLCQNFHIVWKDAQSDDTRPIEYFYQGHMFKKSNEEGIEDIVKGLILQKDPKVFEKFKEDVDYIRHENSGLLSTYFSIKSNLISNKESLKQKGNQEDIEKQILQLNEQIKSYQTENIIDEEINLHEEQIKEISSIENNLEKVKGLQKRIDLMELSEFITFNNPLNIYASFPIIQNEFNNFEESVKLKVTEELVTFKTTTTNKLNQRIKDLEVQLNTLSINPTFKKVNEYLKNSKNLQPFLERKKEEEAKLKEIRDIEEKNKNTQDQLKRLSTEIRANWLKMFEKFTSLTALVNEISISQDIEIHATNIFDQPVFSEFIQKTINQSSEKAKTFASISVNSEQQLLSHFDAIIQAVNNEEVKLKLGSSIETITKEFFDKAWFRVKYEVTYDSDNYNDMSQGKKAFVVLKMSLDCSESKCPIIIDQPEDDLDNRAIYTELVTYLKEKKKERQIILVTHNANVVVNADSELCDS
ncbi:TrlF family AAA-like ATPase [Acinetobacter sp.]|uniref:TrlF family AAA-like ATPase n=1 Tax=Acinetobacter sp. TaxID=472 RepID=UPI0028A5E95E|nr:hypothetical protein [Acinetobacter sp.]